MLSAKFLSAAATSTMQLPSNPTIRISKSSIGRFAKSPARAELRSTKPITLLFLPSQLLSALKQSSLPQHNWSLAGVSFLCGRLRSSGRRSCCKPEEGSRWSTLPFLCSVPLGRIGGPWSLSRITLLGTRHVSRSFVRTVNMLIETCRMFTKARYWLPRTVDLAFTVWLLHCKRAWTGFRKYIGHGLKE